MIIKEPDIAAVERLILITAKMVSIDLKNPSLLQTGAFINNEFITVDGPKFEVINPSTGEPWIELNSCEAKHVDIAVKAADAAFKTYGKLPGRDRAKLLLEWDRLIRENKEDLARILVHETGKPFKEAVGEVDYALTFSWWMAGEAERQHGSTINGAIPNNRFLTLKQPVGVVAALTPWNFPVALIVRKVATALAAGCTVVCKPSPETPVSTLALAVLLKQAGYAPGVVNVLPCDAANTPAIGNACCTHPTIQKVSFTGSTAVGKLLAKQCADTLKKLTLELGGNGPFIIFDDADFDKAINSLMQCKFRHAGQTCVCAQRVFVQEGIYDKVVEALVARIKSDLVIGDSFNEKTTLGPLTTPRSVTKAEGHIKDAVEKGAKIVTGGSKAAGLEGYYFEPTLLTEVNETMIISGEETFAPVLALYRFSTEEEVLARANDTSMGLTSYLFTENANRIWRLMEGIETGNIGVNTGMTTSAEAVSYQ